MQIQITDARGLYTKKLIEVFEDTPVVKSFFGSFFPNLPNSQTLELAIDVQRNTEKIAVDVVRGDDGNRNIFDKSTEKLIIPPYYREYFDITGMSIYDKVSNIEQAGDAGLLANLINSSAKKMFKLRNKIERTLELQRAQVLLTGAITTAKAGTFEFGRRAESLVNNAAWYFAANNDYTIPFLAGATFLRTRGKSQGGVFNAIFGQDAWAALLLNTTFTARQNLYHMQLDGVKPPQANSVGAVLQGYITAGSYRINLWTYPEYYDDLNDVTTEYMDTDMVIMLPEDPKFVTAFGAVPMLPQTEGHYINQGEYTFGEYLDARGKARILDIECAAIAIPVAVDRMFTFRGKAA